jgi:hypothetical protein
MVISSAVALLQSTDLQNAGGFYPSVINSALDKLTILAQQLSEKLSRAVTVPITSAVVPDALIASVIASAAQTSADAASAADSLAGINASTVLVNKTSTTGSAILPAGTTAQRDASPADGYTRFNSTLPALETWYSSAWNAIATTANAVLTTGVQTIAGIKTWTDGIIIGSGSKINFLGASGELQVAGVSAILFNQYGLTTTPITTRQTVELGTVDSSGFPAFGGSTGSTTVTTATTLYLNAANGMVNRRGSITNPSWTSLSTNGTMYAYLDIAADGTCTTGSTTLAPVYQFGGTYSVTSGQFTFNIQEMTGKVGNGATAAQTYRVFVGEVTVAGAVVTAITWYALMGMYAVEQGAPALNTTYTFNHNIGNKHIRCVNYYECITAEGGYTAGERIKVVGDGNAGTSTAWYGTNFSYDKGVLRITTTGNIFIPIRTGGSVAATPANWKVGTFMERSF